MITLMAEKFLIFQKIYDFIKEIYPVVNRFPKSHRPVIGKQIEELSILILLKTMKANKLLNSQRIPLQKDISDHIDSLRILIRLSKDLRFINVKRYLLLVVQLNEIGKMFSCWREK